MVLNSVLFVPVSPLSTTFSPLSFPRQRRQCQIRNRALQTTYSSSHRHIQATQPHAFKLRLPNSPSPRISHISNTHHTSWEWKSIPFATVLNSLQDSLRESTSSVRHELSYAVNMLVPLLLVGALPALPAFAEDDSMIDSAETYVNTSGDSTLGRILGIITLVLLVYASIGAIILTIDNFLIRRNNARETDWVKKRVNGLPYPPTIWSPEIDTEFPSRGGSSKTTGLNREQRRIEKKMKEKEAKEKKKKEQRAEARKKKPNAKT